jgi:hypothetical protein
VPHDTLVNMEIASGPAGAQLDGTIGIALSGRALLPVVSADIPGVHLLRAVGGDASGLATSVIEILPDNKNLLFTLHRQR